MASIIFGLGVFKLRAFLELNQNRKCTTFLKSKPMCSALKNYPNIRISRLSN